MLNAIQLAIPVFTGKRWLRTLFPAHMVLLGSEFVLPLHRFKRFSRLCWSRMFLGRHTRLTSEFRLRRQGTEIYSLSTIIDDNVWIQVILNRQQQQTNRDINLNATDPQIQQTE